MGEWGFEEDKGEQGVECWGDGREEDGECRGCDGVVVCGVRERGGVVERRG